MVAGPVNWDEVLQDLLTRGGGRCEATTPNCVAPGGVLLGMQRGQVSIQHRRARGSGGTRDGEVHCLGNLLLLCGDGVRGCHGWVECRERAAAEERGLWVRRGVTPPWEVPVILGSGRVVRLDRVAPVATEIGWSTDFRLSTFLAAGQGLTTIR